MLAFIAALLVQEQLVLPMQPGFVIAHRQQAENGWIEERILHRETLERWTRMVTIIRTEPDMAPQSYAVRIESGWKRACPGASSGLRSVMRGGRVSAEGRMDCPRNPATGQPETMFVRSFGTSHGLYMVQVAFRHVPSAVEAAWAETQLAAATVTG